MNKIVNGGVSVSVQPGDVLWGCRYKVSRAGTRVNCNLVPSPLTIDGIGKLLDAKGNIVQYCSLFTSEDLCWDHYRNLVASHLKRIGEIAKGLSNVASKAISRCPSVTTTIQHKELVEAFHSAADCIK